MPTHPWRMRTSLPPYRYYWLFRYLRFGIAVLLPRRCACPTTSAGGGLPSTPLPLPFERRATTTFL